MLCLDNVGFRCSDGLVSLQENWRGGAPTGEKREHAAESVRTLSAVASCTKLVLGSVARCCTAEEIDGERGEARLALGLRTLSSFGEDVERCNSC